MPYGAHSEELKAGMAEAGVTAPSTMIFANET